MTLSESIANYIVENLIFVMLTVNVNSKQSVS